MQESKMQKSAGLIDSLQAKEGKEQIQRPKVKICGLTQKEEAAYLNEAGVDYAGFVFYPKSKRHVTIEKAKEIMAELDPSIKKVAVLVSPEAEQIRELEEAGFDILQIHKGLSKEVYDRATKPLWRAINIGSAGELEKLLHSQSRKESVKSKTAEQLSDPDHKIEAYLVDGANFGSGKTFDWSEARRIRSILGEKKFILAGGLNTENIEEGMELFTPDIADVSSGVEGDNGKDRNKVLDFVRKVKRNG